MGIIWFNEKPKEGVVTFTPAHITLNKPATTFFDSAYSVMLGIDLDSKHVIIRPLSKEMTLRNDVPETKKYNITISSSYSRITNKAFIDQLVELKLIEFNKTESMKYQAIWDRKVQALIVDLKEVVS